MEKNGISLGKMLLSLGLICLVASGLLALVQQLTFAPIQQAKADKQRAAIQAVLPPFSTVDTDSIEGHTLYRAYDENNAWVGSAVITETQGYGGTIQLMTGFDQTGKVYNYVVLTHQETPGLGARVETWFKDKVPGTNPGGQGGLKVSKDGGSIDAITAATITSRAFLKGINQAYSLFYQSDTGTALPLDTRSGATRLELKEHKLPKESGFHKKRNHQNQ